MFHVRKRTRLGFVALLASVALVATGCAGGGDQAAPGPDEENVRADRLTRIATIPVPDFDIASGLSTSANMLYEPVFDTLVHIGEDGAIDPWLATEWEYNDDRTVLTMQLRDDVSFTDGTKLDAAAVVASMERLRDGAAGAAVYFAGIEFATDGDYTVTISMDEPNPGLLQDLGVNGFIAAPSSFSDPDIGTKPVGSGPYLLDTQATIPGTTYIYTGNPDYWKADAIHYDNLTVNMMSDPNALINAVKAGEANLAPLNTVDLRSQAESAGWSIATSDGEFWQGLLLLDRGGALVPELEDVRVRRAINMALDREALTAALQGDLGKPIAQPFTSQYSAYDAALDDEFPYDPEEAKKLLAEAGYPDGFEMPMLMRPQIKQDLELISQQLADIGITVQFFEASAAGYISDLVGGKLATINVGIGAPSAWSLARTYYIPTSSMNPFDSQDDELDSLLEEVQFATSEAEADAAWQAYNARMVELAWFAPIYALPELVGVDAGTEVTSWPAGIRLTPSLYSIQPKG